MSITALEIVLLIAGAIVFIVSFIMPEMGSELEQVDPEVTKKQIDDLIQKEMKGVKDQVSEIIEETSTYSVEKTERALERITNEKISAVSEYSDSVMEDIHKSHEEVMFLYDMLNNKHEDLKEAASRVSASVKEARVAEDALLSASEEAKKSSSMLQQKEAELEAGEEALEADAKDIASADEEPSAQDGWVDYHSAAAREFFKQHEEQQEEHNPSVEDIRASFQPMQLKKLEEVDEETERVYGGGEEEESFAEAADEEKASEADDTEAVDEGNDEVADEAKASEADDTEAAEEGTVSETERIEDVDLQEAEEEPVDISQAAMTEQEISEILEGTDILEDTEQEEPAAAKADKEAIEDTKNKESDEAKPEDKKDLEEEIDAILGVSNLGQDAGASGSIADQEIEKEMEKDKQAAPKKNGVKPPSEQEAAMDAALAAILFADIENQNEFASAIEGALGLENSAASAERGAIGLENAVAFASESFVGMENEHASSEIGGIGLENRDASDSMGSIGLENDAAAKNAGAVSLENDAASTDAGAVGLENDAAADEKGAVGIENDTAAGESVSARKEAFTRLQEDIGAVVAAGDLSGNEPKAVDQEAADALIREKGEKKPETTKGQNKEDKHTDRKKDKEKEKEKAARPKSTAKKKKEKQSDIALQFNMGGMGSLNNNEKILELHKKGKSNIAIAKELGLGVGEVKLVLDLFKSV